MSAILSLSLRPNSAASSRRARALDLLLDGRTHAEVVAEVGVTRKTLWRWQRDPRFAGELAERRAQRRASAGARLEAEIARSIDTLVQLRDDPKAPPAVRIKAACEVLDRAGVYAPSAEPPARIGPSAVQRLAEELRTRPRPTFPAASYETPSDERRGLSGSGADAEDVRRRLGRAVPVDGR